MHSESIIFSIFLIFSGAALLSTVALYLRQAMLIAYLVVGAILGPWGLGLVTDAGLISDISNIGIMFLLFLLGLNLSPHKLFQLLRETTLVTIFCTLIFGGVAGGIAFAFGLGGIDALVIGVCASFSSTIIGLKLLPTTVLHHRHMGEVIISILLLQDMIAIIAILVIQNHVGGQALFFDMLLGFVMLPLLGLIAWAGNRFVIFKLLQKFDRIQEYVFLVAIGWCLGLAQLAESSGLSYEIGAFVAGVAIAASPMALHISVCLKPLRDFFLVLFFFALGAGFNMAAASGVILPAILIAAALLLIKPVVFRYLLVSQAETNKLAWETGVRLGQLSEFSLLVVFVALRSHIISEETFYVVQIATIISFIVSTYWIVAKYPTPIAVDDKLRRD